MFHPLLESIHQPIWIFLGSSFELILHLFGSSLGNIFSWPCKREVLLLDKILVPLLANNEGLGLIQSSLFWANFISSSWIGSSKDLLLITHLIIKLKFIISSSWGQTCLWGAFIIIPLGSLFYPSLGSSSSVHPLGFLAYYHILSPPYLQQSKTYLLPKWCFLDWYIHFPYDPNFDIKNKEYL